MNKPLILVVEDDPPVRNLITTTLKTKPHRYVRDSKTSHATVGLRRILFDLHSSEKHG